MRTNGGNVATAYYNMMNQLWEELNFYYGDWNGELMLTSPRRCRKKNKSLNFQLV